MKPHSPNQRPNNLNDHPFDPDHAAGSSEHALQSAFERIREKIAERAEALEEERQFQHQQVRSTENQTEFASCGKDDCCIVSSSQGQRFSLCDSCNPRFKCQICHGLGRSTVVNPLTHTEEMERQGCVCTVKERRVAELNSAKIPNRYLDATFQIPAYLKDAPEQRKTYVRVLKQLEEFAKRAETYLKMGSEPGDKFFLLMFGPVGCGKTYLATALLKRLLMRSNGHGKFIEFQQLLFALRNCYAEGRSEEEILGPLRSASVLVIDELGKARTENEWQMERLDDLINWRYNSGKVTILTTNFKPLNMEEYNPLTYGLRNPPLSEGFWTQSLADRLGLRIYDRLMEVSEVVSFDGLPSLRRLASQKALQIARRSEPLQVQPKETEPTP